MLTDRTMALSKSDSLAVHVYSQVDSKTLSSVNFQIEAANLVDSFASACERLYLRRDR